MKKIVPLSKLSKSALLKKYDDMYSHALDQKSDLDDVNQAMALQTKRHLDQIVKLNAEIKEWKNRFNMLMACHTKVTMSLTPAELQ